MTTVQWRKAENGYVWQNFKIEEVEMAFSAPPQWKVIHEGLTITTLQDLLEAMDYCEKMAERLV